ncbi:DUF5689 domain-containing protein [Flavobacteriaceae bacterium F89]|uniref:DUF5689 domain-containing protein n=1 Tax=Cerina litoralis TaxID=2874477 RepID=A0AAE3EUT9_9FLAO|nr:DUF5689 domain-containing protein [Cerina litoralis]MCG2460136.1 DUF5689 domain-containing protein [Cerina litoralis]
MKTDTFQTIVILVLVEIVFFSSCVKNRDFDPPETQCSKGLIANTTIQNVKDLYVDGTVEIQGDLVLEGVVVSSDKEGNFFGNLHFQDRPDNPTLGLEIEIDVRDSHLFYGVGQKIFVKLKGLYLGKSKGVYKIGGVFTSFGNLSVGRLPAAAVDQHLFAACESPAPIKPRLTTIDGLNADMLSTLIQLDGLEVVDEQVGLPFATPQEETERTLKDCEGNEIVLLNSGYANFQAQPLPDGNGTITGVLTEDNNTFQLVVRDLVDLDFSGKRCPPDQQTSNRVFISELADPDNNSGARFVELYNSGSETLSLKGWSLRRYTNANTEVSSSIDLSNFTINTESTFVISPNAMEFETVYGFAPDLGVKTNSPADSNGDDNLELVDPFGAVIDTFGVIGEDGSGTDHEFEDGRAVRNSGITKANPVYTFGEWTVYNDTGAAGTINLPQNAPEDFTPGIRD